MEIYIFDKTFEGFLTLIFDFYFRKPTQIKVVSEDQYQPSMFDVAHEVMTDETKSKRVKKGLKNKLDSTNYKNLWAVFYSESEEAYQKLFEYCCYILDHHPDVQKNYGHDAVNFVTQMTRKVHREKHHHEAFIRFEEVSKGLYFSKIEPKYNVIPLIISHFQKRYADQDWIIYDLKRKYGIFYNHEQESIQPINIVFTPTNNTLPHQQFEVQEQVYEELWKSYFDAVNIKERKNTKLHIQLLPQRFWKFLPEKRS